MKITIIGCGKMGSSIAQRLAEDHKITLFDRNEERTKKFAQEINASYCPTAPDAVSGAEIIILAIKPQDLDDVAKLVHREIFEEQLIVSVLAGVTEKSLKACFSEIPILRIMPNVAVRHGKGVVGLAESEELSPKLKQKAEKAFSSLGFLHWFPQSKFDALTALTGSGPAFLFVIMESVIDAGITMGIPVDKARELALELFKGATSMLEESEKHPAELKWEVTSPGGTTIAGVNMMEDYGIRSGIINAFLASFHRSKELSQED